MKLRSKITHDLVVAQLIVLVSFASTLEATTALDANYGTPTGAALSRSSALGATGISTFRGSQSVIHNPALLAVSPGRLHIDFTAGITYVSEDRLAPLFDTFSEFVNETIVSTNRNTYALGQGGVVYSLPTQRHMSLSAGVYERYDFDFNFFEELRNPSTGAGPTRDRIEETRDLDVEGILRSFSAGYGAEVAKDVHLGFSVHRYFGRVDFSSRIHDVPANTSTAQIFERELNGWGWTVGGHVQPNERIELGVSYEGPFRVEGTHVWRDRDVGTTVTESDSTRDGGIDYPSTLNFGVTYRPRNVLETTFTVDVVRRFWSALDDDFRPGIGELLHDTWDLRLGLEHVFYNDVPLRFGFRYLENSVDVESERSIFSVGIGYNLEAYRFDITGLYHRQTSRQGFVFDPTLDVDDGLFLGPNTDLRVEDSVLQLVIGVSRGF